MLLQHVVNVESFGPGCRFHLDLACGHRLEWVAVGRKMPVRKHCWQCEFIQNFANAHPRSYTELLQLLTRVPQEDRANALFDWISHCLKAKELCRKIPGLDSGIALRLADNCGAYPLLGVDWS